MRKSISVAFFSTVATLMILGVAVMGLSQLVLFSRYFAQERFATLDDVGDLAARTATYVWKGLDEQVEQSAPEGQDSKVAERLKAILGQVDLIGQSANVYLFFTDSKGQVVLASNSDHLTGDAVPADVLAQVAGAEGGVYHELGKMGGAFDERFYVSARPILRGDEPGAYLFVCASGQMLEAFVGRFGSNFLLSACLMLICASVLTMFLMRNLTEPLHRISEAAQKFGGGDFSVRVEDVDGDGEIADLARTFNTMAANLQEIDSSRGQFMGNIAHELRTPMTTIKGFIDGILDGTIPPELQNHYLQLVSQETGRLARLVQNMLDLSKLESGEYQVNARMFNIWETLTGVALSAEQRINDGQIDLEGLTMDERVLVYADPDLIHQVVYNILDNAIKFTPPGGTIRFSVEKLGPEAEISIWNSGQGIAPDALPFVFERFYKEDKSRGLHARGAGLGLHICKVLVNLSGGQIRAESKQGEWCRFVFTLPVEVPGRGDLLKLSDDTTQEGPDGRPG